MFHKYFRTMLLCGLPWLLLCSACDRFTPIDDNTHEPIRRIPNTIGQENP